MKHCLAKHALVFMVLWGCARPMAGPERSIASFPSLQPHLDALGVRPRNFKELKRDYWRKIQQVRELAQDQPVGPQVEAIRAIQKYLYPHGSVPDFLTFDDPWVYEYSREQLIPGILQVDTYAYKRNSPILREQLRKFHGGRFTWAEEVSSSEPWVLERSTRLQLSHAVFDVKAYGRADSGGKLSRQRSRAIEKVLTAYEVVYPKGRVRSIRSQEKALDPWRKTIQVVLREPASGAVRHVARIFDGTPGLLTGRGPAASEGALLGLELANPDIELPERKLYKMKANLLELGRLLNDRMVLDDLSISMGEIASNLAHSLQFHRGLEPQLMIYAECYPAVANAILDRFGHDGWEALPKQPEDTRIIRISAQDFIEAYRARSGLNPALRLARGEDAAVDVAVSELQHRDRLYIYRAVTNRILANFSWPKTQWSAIDMVLGMTLEAAMLHGVSQPEIQSKLRWLHEIRVGLQLQGASSRAEALRVGLQEIEELGAE